MHRPKSALLALLTASLLAFPACTSSSSSSSQPTDPKQDGNSLADLSGIPQLAVANEDEASVWTDAAGNSYGIVGDKYFTSTEKTDTFDVKVRDCADDQNPPVWLRYYDGPNMYAKDTYSELSFDMPVTAEMLPTTFNQQSLWDQMAILQPEPVLADLAPTYCGFSSSKTIWANGGFNFEMAAGSTGFDLGDARPATPWNSPWQDKFSESPYPGFTTYPLMAIGNGAGGPPAGYAFRTAEGATDAATPEQKMVHAKYSMNKDTQTALLELGYDGASSKYAVPQQLFKDKFLPQVLDSGYMAGDDKQIAQVQNFVWQWMLFTNTLTIQNGADPAGKPIGVDDLKKYFPKTSQYSNIRATVPGFDGFNNPDAFNNTLVCGQGLEIYGTLFDNRAFFTLEDYSKWLDDEADRSDPRYSLWRCLEAIISSRQERCVSSGSENKPANEDWNVTIGYQNDEYPKECDSTFAP